MDVCLLVCCVVVCDETVPLPGEIYSMCMCFLICDRTQQYPSTPPTE
jgi:hypothetical protein